MRRSVRLPVRRPRPVTAPVTAPGDAYEQAASRLAEQATRGGDVAHAAVAPVDDQPLDEGARRWFGPRLGRDFSRVRVHAGPEGAALARSVDARAAAVGDDVALSQETARLPGAALSGVLAHELAHVALGAGRPPVIGRLTPGEKVVDAAHTNWLDPDAAVKTHVDVLRAALKEVKKGKSVAFNKKAGETHVADALTAMGKTADIKTMQAKWDWLVDNRTDAGKAAYTTKEKEFFTALRTPLADLTAKHPGESARYWLKNTPGNVVDAVLAAATADLPADQLYCYVMREGLDKWVRGQIAGLGAKDDPTTAQLGTVKTSTPVSGWTHVGTDDFFEELKDAKYPLTDYLPKGYDTTKVKSDPQVNEKGRTVDPGIYPNLKMGLEAAAAVFRRRRKIFLDDAKAYGYGTPTTDELVYWTYVYYNSGVFNGQLKKFKGKRALGDWITKKEYPNAMVVLESFRMVRDMKIFP